MKDILFIRFSITSFVVLNLNLFLCKKAECRCTKILQFCSLKTHFPWKSSLVSFLFINHAWGRRDKTKVSGMSRQCSFAHVSFTPAGGCTAAAERRAQSINWAAIAIQRLAWNPNSTDSVTRQAFTLHHSVVFKFCFSRFNQWQRRNQVQVEEVERYFNCVSC